MKLGADLSPLPVLPEIMWSSFARRISPIAARVVANRGPALLLSTGGVASALATYSSLSPAVCEPAPVLPLAGAPGTKRERTLILVKPDGVERALVGAIVSKFEGKGYKLVALKMLTPSLSQAEDNYAGLKHLPFFPGLCAYFSSGPIVAMCWEGKDVIKTGRLMVDEVRGVYAADRGRNALDGSDSPEGAAEELARWFKDADVSNYTRAVDAKIYA